jgi:hypothetical protein
MAFLNTLIALIFSLSMIEGCAINVYKCEQTNIIETYKQVKKFQVYVGEFEEFKLKLNSSLIYLEINDINDTQIVKNTYNSTKLNFSLYSKEANKQILNPYSLYKFTLIIPEHLPLSLQILCH